ncbi:class I SAM-dependent methyltransferase [Saccharothrix sp. Mg75]|uniref:class I SAM-dependent methyltransferase n=1 Tax=Saccharothrix sp. Mg75 TaxID=3445357 RepID=UPI003EEE9E37
MSVALLRRERRVRDTVHASGFGPPGRVRVWREDCPPSLNQYFLLRRPDGTWLGRRLLTTPAGFSVVRPHMVMGRFLGLHRHGGGVDFRYRACTEARRHDLFGRPGETELVFPFPVLDDDLREQTCPPGAWDDHQSLVGTLDDAEHHFRVHGARLAAGLLPTGLLPTGLPACAAPVVFDPACSTGAYLRHLADALPGARCVGADLSPAMARRAAAGLPHVLVADAAHPPLAPGSVDLLVVRFLNAEVVPRAAALPAFRRLADLVAPGGHAFVFGHTSVLLDVHRAARVTGLRVRDAVGALPDGTGLFQFYVLGRPGPPAAG